MILRNPMTHHQRLRRCNDQRRESRGTTIKGCERRGCERIGTERKGTKKERDEAHELASSPDLPLLPPTSWKFEVYEVLLAPACQYESAKQRTRCDSLKYCAERVGFDDWKYADPIARAWKWERVVKNDEPLTSSQTEKRIEPESGQTQR